jgi:hypothetical protein
LVTDVIWLLSACLHVSSEFSHFYISEKSQTINTQMCKRLRNTYPA